LIQGGGKFCAEFKHQLESKCNKKIELLEDGSISTAAKFELAENYSRSHHIIRYRSDYPAFVHLQMHELVHLDFIIEARQINENLLFITTQEHKSMFIKDIEPALLKLKRQGVPEKSIGDYGANLFNGISLQVYNIPVDLFIENFLYNKFEEIRPYQFISLFNLLKEGLKAVTDKKVIEHTPANILSKSKIYNIINSIQFKDLFGIDITSEFKASPLELTKAKTFYDEFMKQRDNKKPGEEYKLVLNWAESLDLDKYFEFVDENEYRSQRTDIDGLLESITKDPHGFESNDIYKRRDEDKFQKSQKEIGTNMAVVMFMMDAFNYFKDMPIDKIKEIAFEIAMLGTQGISPDKKGYRINSIRGKEFSGYHMLAYYYVSWKLAIPEMVSQLGLPYEKEFDLAQKMKNN
jgi:hypothetical protein